VGWNDQKFQKAKGILSPILQTGTAMAGTAASLAIKQKLNDINARKQQKQQQPGNKFVPKSKSGGSRDSYELPESVVNMYKRTRSREDV